MKPDNPCPVDPKQIEATNRDLFVQELYALTDEEIRLVEEATAR